MWWLRHNALLALLFVLALANAIIWYAVFNDALRNELTVAFLAVGQGDAIFIEAPNGVQLLIDGGPDARVVRELSRLMPFYDRSLDVVLATHPDADHIGGLPDVLERYEVSAVVQSGFEKESGIYESLLQLTEVERAQRLIARRGLRLWLDESHGIYLDILFPDRNFTDVDDANAASVIARLVFGDSAFLFTGDAPQDVEHYLAWRNPEVLQANVLKVGHHGSDTSTARNFVGWVDPDYAIISAGADNRYGHPDEEVLETLEQFDVEVLQTADEGSLVFTTNGRRLRLKE